MIDGSIYVLSWYMMQVTACDVDTDSDSDACRHASPAVSVSIRPVTC